MHDLKIYEVIEKFSAHELNRLEKFVNSPYFNVSEKLSRLFMIIRQDLKAQKLTRTKAWKAVYGNDDFVDVKFRKLCSDLLRLTEQFLAQEQYESNPLHRANYLLDSVTQRRIESLYKGSISTARRLSSRQIYRPASYYFYQFEIERRLLEIIPESEIKAKTGAPQIEEALRSVIKNLDAFYLAEKLRYHCTLLSFSAISQTSEELKEIDNLINEFENKDHIENIPLRMYYHIYLTYTKPQEEEHYTNLKTLIQSHLGTFPTDQALDIFTAAVNYTVKKVNSGNAKDHEKYNREMFELYQYGIENEVFQESDDNQMVFRNTVVSAARVGEYEWAHKFIDDYQHILNEEDRENAVKFNLARLYWYEKDYSGVMAQLRDVEYKDLFYDLGSKTLLLAVYYELDETEVLLSFADSFKTFLRRNRSMPQTRKDHYQKFINATRKLTLLRQAYEPNKLKKLRTEIQGQGAMVNKSWIEEKMGDLESSLNRAPR